MSLARAPYRVKGWHVGAGVVAFFAIVIAVDASFMILAYRTHPGQTVVRPYEDGLVYNARLERERAQARLGWSASAAAEPGRIVVQMRDREGRPLQGLAVTATLERPATDQGRTTRLLQEEGPGRYVSAPGPLAGTWDARIVAKPSAGGQTFEASRRLTWP